MSTKKRNSKLEFLRRYAERNFDAFRKKYSDNVIGIHIGKKKRGNKTLPYYTFVFHVVHKKNDLKFRIPKYISVRIPEEGTKRIKTDVIETGRFYLTAAQPGSRISVKGRDDFGTVSCFIRKGDNIYACSNMHVLAPGLIAAGETQFYRPIPQQTTMNVVLRNNEGSCGAYLEAGRFNGIDAAIARIDPRAEISKLIPGIGAIVGIGIVSYSNYAKMQVRMRGTVSGVQNGRIDGIGIVQSTSIPGVKLTNLIRMRLYSQHGDSGAPIVDQYNNIIGILLGRDTSENMAYAIPIQPILKYFQAQLL